MGAAPERVWSPGEGTLSIQWQDHAGSSYRGANYPDALMLDEVLNELTEGKEADVVARIKHHVERNKAARTKPS